MRCPDRTYISYLYIICAQVKTYAPLAQSFCGSPAMLESGVVAHFGGNLWGGRVLPDGTRTIAVRCLTAVCMDRNASAPCVYLSTNRGHVPYIRLTCTCMMATGMHTGLPRVAPGEGGHTSIGKKWPRIRNRVDQGTRA